MIPSAAKIFWRNSRKRTDVLYIESPADIFLIENDMGLPELSGSSKQVKWARKIRVNILVPLKFDIPEDLLDED